MNFNESKFCNEQHPGFAAVNKWIFVTSEFYNTSSRQWWLKSYALKNQTFMYDKVNILMIFLYFP